MTLTLVVPRPAPAIAPVPVKIPRRRRGLGCVHLRVDGRQLDEENYARILAWKALSRRPVLPLRCAISGTRPSIQWARDVCTSSWCRSCPLAEGDVGSVAPQNRGRMTKGL